MLRKSYARYCTRQPIIALVVACCVLFVLFSPYWVYSPQEFVGGGRVIPTYRSSSQHHDKASSYFPGLDPASNSSTPTDHTNRCAGFPNLDDILIVIKTGATEAFEKVPIQFLTFLQCVEDKVLVFSDMEQDLGPHHVYDALEDVTEETTKDNPDFDLYRIQQEYKKEGIEVGRTLHGAKADDAWNLDKYKNVRVAKKAYELRPNASWYVFIDADTYVVWPSLLPWLAQLDAAKPLYLGSLALINDIPFAHGGSGYVLSAKAMENFIGKNPGVAAEFDIRAKHECCGDVNLAIALSEKKVAKLTQVWPMINGEKPRTLPFGPSHWCQPIVTMHHVTVEEVNELWWYEQRRPDPSKPLLMQELYQEFFAPHLREWRNDWDNTADDARYKEPSAEDDEDEKDRQRGWNDLERNAHKSYDDCKAACSDNDGCFQFVYRPNAKKCNLAWSFKLGSRQLLKIEEEEKAESGWLVERIQKWVDDKGNCIKPAWVKGS